MSVHRIIVVDLFTYALALAQRARQVFLLLLIVMAQQLLPVGGVSMLRLLFQDLRLWLIL